MVRRPHFSPLAAGKMNLTKCCRHHPTRFHIHRGGTADSARAHPSAPRRGPGERPRQDARFASFASSTRLFPSPEIHPLWGAAWAAPPGLGFDDTGKQMLQEGGGGDEAAIRG